tara:strand:+ start:65 stop:277 length:213 start_codon:yes stop_codon:yes gene_type:complete
MLFILSISFLGYGITELQEVGIFDTTLWLFIPKITILGIYPTMETFIPQLCLLILLSWSVYNSFFRKKRI